MTEEQTEARRQRLMQARKARRHVGSMHNPAPYLLAITEQEERDAEDAMRAANEEIPHPLQNSFVDRRN